MKFSTIQKEILKDLFRASEGLDLFTFWRRYRISPAEMFKIVDKLEKNNLVHIVDERIFLTTYGRKYLTANRSFLTSRGKRPWREIPDAFKAEKLPVNKPIAPILSLMDRNMLPKQWRR